MADSLDLVQLRTFVTIAECGGFGRAASALHLSQSTVSQHVRLLEKRLGQALVEKDGRQTRFTDAGARLLVEARRIFAVHDDALARLDVGHRSSILIGSTETAADQVLPQILSTLRDVFPEREVRFQIDRSTQMTEAVARGTVDLAIILGLTSETPGRKVGTLPLRWYAAPTWTPPAPGEPWPLVAYAEPCGMRQRAFQELGDAGHLIRLTTESTTLEGVTAAARAGLGVAVLPSTGPAPAGLVERTDLPELGMIGVHLAARRGLDVNIEIAALDALDRFFARLTADAAAPTPPTPQTARIA